ncbi:MAG: galactose mutarotase [Acidobacteria bacterium]|nr:galactose mutarotase [Acidobacteriota bacterium]
MNRASFIKALIIVFAVGSVMTLFCGFGVKIKEKAEMKKETFGKLADGTPVDIYTLTNDKGMEVKITNYGGIVVSVKTPDRNGKFDDLVLGYDLLESYLKRNPMFGTIVGRYANRIGKAKFTLNGIEYSLARNNGENHIHGGPRGFDKQVWKAKPVSQRNGLALELSYLSKDGEESYPGNLSITVTYTLTNSNELKINYLATTDKDTVINLTNHSYFNLAGDGDVLGHVIMIDADRYTPVGPGLIPTGELRSVKGTPLDFSQPLEIGKRIDSQDEQMVLARGYDHNFVLNHKPGELGLAARVHEPKTGRVLEVFTTEPGVQLYTGNNLDGSITGKGGRVYGRRSGFCLETQHFPDSPNKPQFPSAVLKKGEKYRTTTVYKFSVI